LRAFENALIVAEIFFHLLCMGPIKLSESSVVLQKIRLDWIIRGRIYDYGREANSSLYFIH